METAPNPAGHVAHLDVEWPLHDTTPSYVVVTFGDGTVARYSGYVDHGSPRGMAGVCSVPYLDVPAHTTAEQDEAAEWALSEAYERWCDEREAA